jgi:hypothetical protein
MNRIRRCPPGPCGGRRQWSRLADHLHRSRQPRPGAPTRQDADPTRSDPPVINLVTRAANSDQQTSDALIERHAPLAWSICRTHKLSGADAYDAGQSVCLQLVDQLDRAHDPAALPPPPSLRRHPETALINTEADSARSEINGQAMVQ